MNKNRIRDAANRLTVHNAIEANYRAELAQIHWLDALG